MRGSIPLIIVFSLVLQASVPVMFTTAQDKNSPPTVSLISPTDKAVIHDPTPTFSWKAEDPERDPLTFDLHYYLYTGMPHIGSSVIENLEGTNYTLTKPLQSSDWNYIWYVVAHDGHSTQDSHLQSWQFKVDKNTPPQIFPIPKQNITLGDELRFNVDAFDIDPQDRGNLTFGLENGPSGVDFDQVNHTFIWRPKEDQLGNYTMIVTASDNYITIKETFKIKVSPEEKKTHPNGIASWNNVWVLWIILVELFVGGCTLMYKGTVSEKKASKRRKKHR
jgi:hypothetical protein